MARSQRWFVLLPMVMALGWCVPAVSGQSGAAAQTDEGTSTAAGPARGQGSSGNNVVVQPFLLSLEKYAPGRGPVAPPNN